MIKRIKHGIGDIYIMTKRNLKRYLRLPQLLVFATIQPVMFVLLFTYVFGGAIKIQGVEYIDFLMPGIFIHAVLFGSVQTGVGLADDFAHGMVERFRSLPMARSALLMGRALADSVRNVFVVLLMTGVGALIGFRFHIGVLPAIAALTLVILFGSAFSWVSAVIGIMAKTPEAAQVASFIWVFPIVFASSAFVPISTMPEALRVFAEQSPVTVTIDAVRALTLGGEFGIPMLKSLAWIFGILLVFIPLAVHKYRKNT